MSSKHTELARQRASVESLLRHGRAIAERSQISMESAEAYSAMVDVVTHDLVKPVVDGTKTPDEVLEEAYQRLEARNQEIGQAIESQEEVDNLMGDTVSLDSEENIDQILELADSNDSLEALRNTARLIYHTPRLRRSKAALESLQRYAAHQLKTMPIPRSAYKSILKKNASLESIHSTLNKLATATGRVMDNVSNNVQTVSNESLVATGNVDLALKIQRVQQKLGAHAEKRGGKQ